MALGGGGVDVAVDGGGMIGGAATVSLDRGIQGLVLVVAVLRGGGRREEILGGAVLDVLLVRDDDDDDEGGSGDVGECESAVL